MSETERSAGVTGGDASAGGGVSGGFLTAVGRGLSLKCPMCGHGRMFRGLIRMERRCCGCGFQFERAPGYFLGSTYINYGLTAGLTTASYVILHFGFRVSNAVLLPGLLTFCAIFPVVFFRYARSLWLSLDCCFDRTGAEEGARRGAESSALGDSSKTSPETKD